jgi:hypothetical protein
VVEADDLDLDLDLDAADVVSSESESCSEEPSAVG